MGSCVYIKIKLYKKKMKKEVFIRNAYKIMFFPCHVS